MLIYYTYQTRRVYTTFFLCTGTTIPNGRVAKAVYDRPPYSLERPPLAKKLRRSGFYEGL
jgi:hypothetical protein